VLFDLHSSYAEWRSHPPGYFKVALFDHHMPICDGLTAARRIREMEAQKGIEVRKPCTNGMERRSIDS
jgi:CheY-like chemotaxis protein